MGNILYAEVDEQCDGIMRVSGTLLYVQDKSASKGAGSGAGTGVGAGAGAGIG